MSDATLNGHRVKRARVTIPDARNWLADVQLEEDVALVNGSRATLVIDGLTLQGTSSRGGVFVGAGSYRIVGGAGGWGKQVEPQGYAAPGGVLASTVIGDVARLSGETVQLASDFVVGPSFARERASASRILEQLAPDGWYVDSLGVTRVGARPSGSVDPKAYETIERHPDLGYGVIATETPEAIVPGLAVTVGEFTFVPRVVRHVLDAGAIRTEVWERNTETFGDLAREFFPRLTFFGVYEFRVVRQTLVPDTTTGGTLEIEPVDPSIGLPELATVPMRPGLAGSKVGLQIGTLVLVGFVNGDPGRPYVLAYEDVFGGGFLPIETSIDASDKIKIGDGATESIALSTSLYSAFMAIFDAWVVVPNDGGGALKTVWSAWKSANPSPGPWAASKAKAE
jgi:hypothetical protein